MRVINELFTIREEVRAQLAHGVSQGIQAENDIWINREWPAMRSDILTRIEEIGVKKESYDKNALIVDAGKNRGEICLKMSQEAGRALTGGGRFSTLEQRLKSSGAKVAIVRRTEPSGYGKPTYLKFTVIVDANMAAVEEAVRRVREDFSSQLQSLIDTVEENIRVHQERQDELKHAKRHQHEQEVESLQVQAHQRAEDVRMQHEAHEHERRARLEESLQSLTQEGVQVQIDESGAHVTATFSPDPAYIEKCQAALDEISSSLLSDEDDIEHAEQRLQQARQPLVVNLIREYDSRIQRTSSDANTDPYIWRVVLPGNPDGRRGEDTDIVRLIRSRVIACRNVEDA